MNLKKPQWVGLILLALAATGGSVMYFTTTPQSPALIRLPMELLFPERFDSPAERSLSAPDPRRSSVDYILKEELPDFRSQETAATLPRESLSDSEATGEKSLLSRLKDLVKNLNPFGSKDSARRFQFPLKPQEAALPPEGSSLPSSQESSLGLVDASGVSLLDQVQGALSQKESRGASGPGASGPGAFKSADGAKGFRSGETQKKRNFGLPEALRRIEARTAAGEIGIGKRPKNVPSHSLSKGKVPGSASNASTSSGDVPPGDDSIDPEPCTTELCQCLRDCGTDSACRSECRGDMPPTCFTGETMILTQKGKVPIQIISAGDTVYSVNLESKKLVPAKVSATHRHLAKKILRVLLSNGVALQATPEHLFYSVSLKEYLPIGKFHAGDRVLYFSHEKHFQAEEVSLQQITTLPIAPTQVYNLTLEGELKNYLAAGVLVHNKPQGPMPLP